VPPVDFRLFFRTAEHFTATPVHASFCCAAVADTHFCEEKFVYEAWLGFDGLLAVKEIFAKTSLTSKATVVPIIGIAIKANCVAKLLS